MEDKLTRQIEREGAEALLDIGVSIPLLRVRLPFRRDPLELRVTMKRPTLSGQIRLARTYLSLGVTSEQLWEMSKEEQMRFVAEHGEELSRMIAITVCRDYWKRLALSGVTAWAVRQWMPWDLMIGAMKRFIGLLSTDPFLPIIRSAEVTNVLRPRLSQKERRS